MGRWLTRDPIGLAGGMNFYGYVGNNPVNAMDPFGLYTPKRYLTLPHLGEIPFPSLAEEGHCATQWYAEVSVDPNVNLFLRVVANGGGWFASLWTDDPNVLLDLWVDIQIENSDLTFTVLITAAGLRWQGIPMEPIHIGYDIPFTGLNIFHYGRHVQYGQHLGLYFKGQYKTWLHIYAQRTFPFIRCWPPLW